MYNVMHLCIKCTQTVLGRQERRNMTVSVGLGGSKPDARPHKFICICLAWDALTVETAHIFTISTPQQSLRDEIALTVYNTEFWKWSKYRPNVFSVVLNCQLQSLVVGPVPQREGHGCMQDHSSRQTDTEFPPNWASALKKIKTKSFTAGKKWFVVRNHWFQIFACVSSDDFYIPFCGCIWEVLGAPLVGIGSLLQGLQSDRADWKSALGPALQCVAASCNALDAVLGVVSKRLVRL